MSTKLHRNTFKGGMDKETDPVQLENIKYSDGYNVSLSQDGRDKKLSSFFGTKTLGTVLAAGVVGVDNSVIHVMGMYEAIYLLDDVETKAALAFIYNSSNTTFSIFAVLEDGTIYTQYEEIITLSDDKRFVDCVIYKEGGTAYAYFSDYETELKKLPCVIDTTGKGGTEAYKREDIQLLRKGFKGDINRVIAIGQNNGGDLMCGTYQFALRLHNSSQNKYTKWGLLTNPAVIGMNYSTGERSYGGAGYVSAANITLTLDFDINYTSPELYTHYQLAVIENITGTQATTLTAKVLQPETMPAITTTYNYNTNKRAKELILVDELVVDDAAIKAVRTLAIKNNRLLVGNIKYHPLDYDRGNPVIATTTAPLQKVFTGEKSVAYRNLNNATNYVGYFRDELYRFGIVYEDEFGNYSRPKILDFSALENTNIVTRNNWIDSTSSSKDYRFPPRGNGKYGTLLGLGGDTQALGLRLMGVTNHPTWAVKFHIVRVPRKKKILFQTPIVPSILVQPAKAIGDYPSQKSSTDTEDIDVLNVEATNPDGSFVPKNFYHVLPKSLIRFGDFYGTVAEGGAVYASNLNSIFPSDGNKYALTPVAGGTTYNVNEDDNETLLYTNEATVVYEVQVYINEVNRDIVPADNVTITLASKVRGQSIWGAATTYSTYDTGVSTFSLNTTLNDYLFTIESLNQLV